MLSASIRRKIKKNSKFFKTPLDISRYVMYNIWRNLKTGRMPRKENKMKSDVNGCSTCPKGQEQYEEFTMGRKKYVQYDYRTEDGELFSCVKIDLAKCRFARDMWLANRKTK